MRIPPIDVLINWPRPNYINPVDRGPGLLIIETAFLGLALTCLCLRMYVRMFMIRQTWWDDWLMCAGMVFCIGVTICVILGEKQAVLSRPPAIPVELTANGPLLTDQQLKCTVGICTFGTYLCR